MPEGVIRARFSAREKKSKTSSTGRAMNWVATFGGTNRGGVRVDFREPVSQLGVRVPALYLTVEDIEGFAAALAEHGLPGTDTRRAARLPPSAMPDAGQDDAMAHATDRDP